MAFVGAAGAAGPRPFFFLESLTAFDQLHPGLQRKAPTFLVYHKHEDSPQAPRKKDRYANRAVKTGGLRTRNALDGRGLAEDMTGACTMPTSDAPHSQDLQER